MAKLWWGVVFLVICPTVVSNPIVLSNILFLLEKEVPLAFHES